MTIININTDDIPTFQKKGGSFILKREAEDDILALLNLRDQIDLCLNDIKNKIAQAGNAIDPNFKGVVGEKVKAVYRRFGERYGFDPTQVPDLLLRGFVFQKITHRVDIGAVERYITEHGGMPNGIEEKPRVKQISIVKTNYEKNTPELQSPESLVAGEDR